MTESTDDPQRCIACGTAFMCGMSQDTACWCSVDFAPVMPMPDAAGGCYCRECLTALIASRQAQRAI